MKKIIALIIVFASITPVWAIKNSTSQTAPTTEASAAQDPMFELVATGDFKLEDVVGKGYPVIINFSATWCGPCRMLKPIFKEANEDYKGKAILKTIDVDDESMRDIVRAAGVSAIPHQIFYYPDGSMPTADKSPKLFEDYGLRERVNKRTGDPIIARSGYMTRDMIDGIIKELSSKKVATNNALAGNSNAKGNDLFDINLPSDFKLEDIVGKGYPVIINFSAKWCGPCQKMKPHYLQANKDYNGKVILKTIDVEDPGMRKFIAEIGVSAVPQQILFYADGSAATAERSPVLFEKYRVKEQKNNQTGKSIAVRIGAINRDMIDEIIKELSSPK